MKLLLFVFVICLGALKSVNGDAEWGDIEVISASRKSTPQGTEFSIEYKVDGGTSVRVNWRDPANNFARIQDQTTAGDDGSVVSTVVSASSSSYIIVSIGDYTEWITLALNSGSSDQTQTDIEIPALEIEPEGDLVYDAGTDKQFQVTHTRITDQSVNQRLPLFLIRDGFIVYQDPQDNKLYSDNGFRSGFLQVLNREESDGEVKLTVKVDTSNYPTNGFITFTSVSANYESGELVGMVQVGTSVSLYPNSKSSAFEDGFMDLVSGFRAPKTPEGVEIVQCEVGSPMCLVACAAGGSSIGEVKLSKVLASGELAEVAKGNAFSDDLYFAVPYQAAPVAEAPTRFKCEASSQDGNSVQKIIEVQPYKAVSIVSASYKSNDDDTLLLLYCEASGTPQIYFTFWVNYGGPNYWVQFNPEAVFPDGNNLVALATVTSPPPGFQIECNADQVVNGIQKHPAVLPAEPYEEK